MLGGFGEDLPHPLEAHSSVGVTYKTQQYTALFSGKVQKGPGKIPARVGGELPQLQCSPGAWVPAHKL